MAYFPMFVELEGERCLVVGGGPVAARKAAQLLGFGASVRLVAPGTCDEVPADPRLEVVARPFAEADLADCRLAVAATNDPQVNHRVAEAARAARIPVNVVDDKGFCDFAFGAMVHEGPLSIGISTSGASPAMAAWLRRQTEAHLPDYVPEVLAFLEEARPLVLDRVPAGPARTRAFQELLARCVEKGAGLPPAEVEDVLREVTAP